MMKDIASALQWIERERLRRDREILELRRKDWTLSRIADKVGVTRQRVQQILVGLGYYDTKRPPS